MGCILGGRWVVAFRDHIRYPYRDHRVRAPYKQSDHEYILLRLVGIHVDYLCLDVCLAASANGKTIQARCPSRTVAAIGAITESGSYSADELSRDRKEACMSRVLRCELPDSFLNYVRHL
jgi:hypothetical protein